MNDGTFGALLYAISSDVVRSLVRGGMGLGESLRAFYSSRVCAELGDRETGLWREPTRVLLAMLDDERRAGAGRSA